MLLKDIGLTISFHALLLVCALAMAYHDHDAHFFMYGERIEKLRRNSATSSTLRRTSLQVRTNTTYNLRQNEVDGTRTYVVCLLSERKDSNIIDTRNTPLYTLYNTVLSRSRLRDLVFVSLPLLLGC